MNNLYPYFKILVLSTTIVYNASGQTVTLFPQKDNTIYSEGDSSNGKGYYLFTGATNSGAERRALIKFDLSTIPSTDSIVTASFQVLVSKTISGAQKIKLFKLSGDWGESNSDAKFEEGGGAIPQAGDATWNYAFFNTTSWTQAGGDYAVIPTDSIEIAGTGSYTWSGDGVAADVQNWIKNPSQNYGWIIITDDKTSSSKRINSGNNPDNQPQLIIQTVSTTGYLLPRRDTDFKIYPNPGIGEFLISNNTIPIANIRIIDLTGKEIEADYISNSRLGTRLSLTQKGMYIVIINNTYYKKLIVL